MKTKKQIIFIRGGETFENKKDFYKYLKTVELDPYEQKKRWRDWIVWALSEKYDVITPLMPAKQNADYGSWKIWFERHFIFIKDKQPILIGHSLGATFLLKYLSENKFPKKISQLHLVAPVVFNDGIGLEKLSTFNFNVKKVDKILKICKEIHLWHSEDDPVCLFENSEIIKKEIPEVNFHVFKDRGHFGQPSFPEILEIINKKN